MRAALLVALLPGCWGRGAAPPPAAAPVAVLPATPAIEALPGLAWYVPPAPFHPHYSTHALAAQGDHLLLGHDRNHISLVDRKTGRTLVEGLLPRASATEDTFMAFSITALGEDRWFVGGLADSGRAYVVEGPQLTARLLPQFDGTKELHAPVVAAATDAGVVVAAEAHGLVLCDPHTFAVTRELDSRTGWWDLSAFGSTALATNDNEVVRFDLATGAAAQIATMANHPANMGRVAANGIVIDPRASELVILDGSHATSLRGTDGFAEVDSAGTRLLTWRADDKTLQIRALPSGEILRTFPPGERVFAPGAMIENQFIGEFGAHELRTFDLDRGTLSPRHAGVSGWDNHVAVAPDGSVLVTETEQRTWWLGAGGAVIRTHEIGEDAHAFGRYVEIPRDSKLLDNGPIDVLPKPPHPLPHLVEDAQYYLGDRRVVAVYLGEDKSSVARLATNRGGADEPLLDVSTNGGVLDVDPDVPAVIAATRYARVWSAGRANPTRFELPDCEIEDALFERGGDRFVAWDKKVIAAWHRTSGAPIGSAIVLDDTISDVLFIHGRREILVVTDDEQLIAWTPGGLARTIHLPHLVHPGVSADGRWLALTFGGGAVALVALDPLLAAFPAGARPHSAPDFDPAACGDPDVDGDPTRSDPFATAPAPADDDQ